MGEATYGLKQSNPRAVCRVWCVGLRPLRKGLIDFFDGANSAIPVKLFRYLRVLYEELCGLDEQIKHIDKDIQDSCHTNPLFKALPSIPGCGSLVAAACLREMGSGQPFQSGRQFSALPPAKLLRCTKPLSKRRV